MLKIFREYPEAEILKNYVYIVLYVLNNYCYSFCYVLFCYFDTFVQGKTECVLSLCRKEPIVKRRGRRGRLQKKYIVGKIK